MDNTYKQPSGRKIGIKIAVFAVILVAVVFGIYFFVRGKETTSGTYPDPVESHPLICSKVGAKYPKIDNVESDSKEISLTMIFEGTEGLKSISLDYTLSFKDKTEVEKAEADAHVGFSKSLSTDGLSFSEFNNKFSKYETKLIVSLFGSGSDIADETRARFFMIDTEKQGKPNTLEEFRKVYTTQGFTCVLPNDK